MIGIEGPTDTAIRIVPKTFTAGQLLSPAWTGSDALVTTTDGLHLLIKEAATDGTGRITARLSVVPSTAKERSDLNRIDGCEVDFAPSTPLSQGGAFNCRVFGRRGNVGSLRIPGIKDIRPVGR